MWDLGEHVWVPWETEGCADGEPGEEVMGRLVRCERWRGALSAVSGGRSFCPGVSELPAPSVPTQLYNTTQHKLYSSTVCGLWLLNIHLRHVHA